MSNIYLIEPNMNCNNLFEFSILSIKAVNASFINNVRDRLTFWMGKMWEIKKQMSDSKHLPVDSIGHPIFVWFSSHAIINHLVLQAGKKWVYNFFTKLRLYALITLKRPII